MPVSFRPTSPGNPTPPPWNQSMQPGFLPQSLTLFPPTPKQDELMTRDEAVSLLEKHLQDKDNKANLWFVNTILYIILEGDKTCGRAFVCDPYAAFLVLGLCDRINKRRLDIWATLKPSRRSNLQGMNLQNRQPVDILYDIFEFSYDFRLSEEKGRFRSLRAVRMSSYLLNAEKLPKHWGTQLWLSINRSTYIVGYNPMRVGGEMPIQAIIGEPLSSQLWNTIPVSHPVEFIDDDNRRTAYIDRTIKGLLRLPKYETRETGNPLGFIENMNWYALGSEQKIRFLRALPTLLETLWDEDASRDQVYNWIQLLLKLRINQTMPSLYSRNNWRSFREVITFLQKHTPDEQLLTGNYKNYQDSLGTPFKPIPLLLLLWCLGSYKYAKTKDKIVRKEITDLIRECIDSSPLDEELLKNLTFASIFHSINHSFVMGAASLNEKTVNIETSPDKKQLIYDRMCELNPALAGFVATFGMPEEITLHAGWYQSFRTLCYRQPTPAFITDQSEAQRRQFRSILRDLFTLVDHFTIDTSGMHGGERKSLATMLVDTGSEEIVKTALDKNMTTPDDLRRVMRSIVNQNTTNPVIPYLIYILQCQKKPKEGKTN